MPEELLEIQKKMTVRTMAKDIAKLREAEVGVEREKIMKLKPGEETKATLKLAEEERKKREKEIMMAKKKSEEEKKRIEVEKKMAEEERKMTELDAKKKIETERLIKEKETFLAKQKEKEEIQRSAEEEKIKGEAELKAAEEERKRKEQEIILAREREEEARKEAEEEKLEKTMEEKITEEERRKTRLKEILEKFKFPAAEKIEAEEVKKTEEKPKLEETFFKRIFPAKTSREAPELEKSPEELLAEKIAQIEAQREKEKKEREEFLKRVSEEKIEVKPPIIKEEPISRYPLMAKIPPKRSALFEKVFVRVIVIGFLVASWAALFTFWYWFLVAKNPQTVVVSPETPTVEKKEVIVPPSLIPIQLTKTLDYTTPENLKLELYQILKEKYLDTRIQRIVIQDKTAGKVLSLQEFFETLGVVAPVPFYQKLDSDFTLFLYPAKNYNRIGFVAKIKDRENLTTGMKSWEPTMEENFENLFILLDKEKPALISYFRGAQYKGVSLRFQTFTKQDLGICYAILNDYFIWTSSWESLTKVIDLLKY